MTGPERQLEVVLGCPGELGPTIEVLREVAGLRLRTISPADDPQVAVLATTGLTVRLDRHCTTGPGSLRITRADGPRRVVAPNGTVIDLVPPTPPRSLPELRSSFIVSRASEATWATGRAGMRYRDLIPDRQGGRFIASHIHIPDAGPVPDQVHYHDVSFQVIVCHRGWVRLVYEDQGPAFVLGSGQCVVQPPFIRHRVLECSADLQVIEVSCPAVHDTHTDDELALPTANARPERQWAGQRFLHPKASDWQPGPDPGWDVLDLGIAAATGGVGGVRRWRTEQGSGRSGRCQGDLLLFVVREGSLRVEVAGHDAVDVATDDAVVVPTGHGFTWSHAAPGTEVLEVAVPG